MSKRHWDSHMVKWRKDLHAWDPVAPEAAAGGQGAPVAAAAAPAPAVAAAAAEAAEGGQ